MLAITDCKAALVLSFTQRIQAACPRSAHTQHQNEKGAKTMGVSFPGKVGTAPFSSTAAQAVSGLQLTLIVLAGSRLSLGDRPERKGNRVRRLIWRC